MKAEVALKLSDVELQRMLRPGSMNLGVHQIYVSNLQLYVKNHGVTLDQALEIATEKQDEHTPFFVMAYQYLKGVRKKTI